MGADYVQLGKNVRKYRRIADLTQAQLANLTGYTESHIGSIEKANGIPSYEALVKIADALNVTMDQLSYGSIRNWNGYLAQEYLRLTEGLDKEDEQFAVDMIVALLEQIRKHSKGD